MTDLATFFDSVLRNRDFSRSMNTVRALLAGAEAEASQAPNNPLALHAVLSDSVNFEPAGVDPAEETVPEVQSYRSEADGFTALGTALALANNAKAALSAGDDSKAIIEGLIADGLATEAWLGVLEAGFDFEAAGAVELVPFVIATAPDEPSSSSSAPTPGGSTGPETSTTPTSENSSASSTTDAKPEAEPAPKARAIQLLEELLEELAKVLGK